ncbi:uncharacterized protein [Branchiostoma lanceolatum]|uniref:uncharacterized protein n=1 Tax=Branchiostoma lanceolatum TaxID=7740 RepID=UPI0034522C99
MGVMSAQKSQPRLQLRWLWIFFLLVGLIPTATATVSYEDLFTREGGRFFGDIPDHITAYNDIDADECARRCLQGYGSYDGVTPPCLSFNHRPAGSPEGGSARCWLRSSDKDTAASPGSEWDSWSYRNYNQRKDILAPQDCADIFALGIRYSHVYTIGHPQPFQVYCDMDTDGGGWTVIQRRQDGSVPFDKTWTEYEQGFGNSSGEYWLGLGKIHSLTSQKQNELYVYLEDWEMNSTFARYSTFSVGNGGSKYTATIDGYSGDASDSLNPSDTRHSINNRQFSTTDQDNDGSSTDCAGMFGQGGWWYTPSCGWALLNGQYLTGCSVPAPGTCSSADGIVWKTWRGYTYSLKKTVMMIRPDNFPVSSFRPCQNFSNETLYSGPEDSGLYYSCACAEGWYGAFCDQECGHCYLGPTCDRYDGTCPTGGDHVCTAGYFGDNCHQECPDFRYGADDCTQTCHCANGPAACNKTTGACTGGCLDFWTGDSCQIRTASVLYEDLFTKEEGRFFGDSPENIEAYDNIDADECARRCLQGYVSYDGVTPPCLSFNHRPAGSPEGGSARCWLRSSDKDTASSPGPEWEIWPSRNYYQRKDILAPQDCADIFALGLQYSHFYTIGHPQTFQVYCDMDTDGGGWTIIQRRQDGSVPFDKNWTEYEQGFGNPRGEYWLGLENIHSLTSQKQNELYVYLEDWEMNSRFARYSTFSVGDAGSKYTATIGGYRGDATDSLDPSTTRHSINNRQFSTTDQDNDGVGNTDCAGMFGQGGWWYTPSCGWALLNGQYLTGCSVPAPPSCSSADGIVWETWRGYTYSLKKTVMMIRPDNSSVSSFKLCQNGRTLISGPEDTGLYICACAPGWNGPFCEQECDPGRYSYDCAETCGNCASGTVCNRTDGSCPFGCHEAWAGAICKQKPPTSPTPRSTRPTSRPTSQYTRPVITESITKGVSIAPIAGGSAAVLLMVFLVAVGIICFRRRNATERQDPIGDQIYLNMVPTDNPSSMESAENPARSTSHSDSSHYETAIYSVVDLVTVNDVEEFLRAKGFDQYAPAFKRHKIDGDAAMCLNDAVLAELIPEIGPRVKLQKALQELKDNPEAANSSRPVHSDWEIPRSSLTLGKILGKGQFGEVRLGELRKRGVTQTVAVKTLKVSAEEKDKEDLIGELDIMVTVGRHDNIISLVGACTLEGTDSAYFLLFSSIILV